MGISLLIGVVEINDAPYEVVYKSADFLSNIVLLWRFFCPSISTELYLKMSILEKREVRARMFLSVLLIIQAAVLIVFSRKEESIEERAAWRLIIVACYSVIFALFKIKYAVDFRSRVLQMGAYISFMDCLMVTFRVLVMQDGTMTQYQSLFFMFLGCLCGFFGFFIIFSLRV